MKWINSLGIVMDDCVVVHKTNDENFGALSNMKSGFPLRVCDIVVPSSEALYQALRYPNYPEIQQEIIAQANPFQAKLKSKKGGRRRLLTRPDWDVIRVDVMRWCLRVKLVQNFDLFFDALMATGRRPIVERSRADRFWGAVEKDDALHGDNQLGCLLSELRDEVKTWLYAGDEDEPYPPVLPPQIEGFLLLGHTIGPIDSE